MSVTGTRYGAGSALDRRRTLVLAGAGASLIACCYGLARFAYGLFLPSFRSEFMLDAATAGVIAAGSYVAYCVGIALASLLTDRVGARRVAVAAGLLAAGGTAMIAAAPTTAFLAAGVLLAGTSTGVASPPLAHAVALSVSPAIRDRTQTVINAGTGVGVALAGPIALVAGHQWRWAWAAFALTSALVTVWVARSVPPAHDGHRSPKLNRTAARAHPLQVPPGAWRLVTASAVLGVASSAVWTFGRDVLVSEGGMGHVASTTSWIVLGGFGVFGALAGDAPRRIGERPFWATTIALLAAATALVGTLPSMIGIMWGAAAVFGAAYIALTGVLLIWGAEVFAQRPATGVGLAFLTIALGQAAGSIGVGTLLELAGAHTAFLAAAAVGVSGALIGPRER
ncbi:MAG: MFS transporter [Brachybacterium sp.]|nr:MFS transporter [Brachybacterium sp.]